MNQDALFTLLSEATGMVTLTVQSLPQLRKRDIPNESTIKGAEVTKVARVQVNPVKHYRRLKAKALGVKPSEVEVQARPGWTHISEGIVENAEGDRLFQCAPVRTLEAAYQVNGRAATQDEVATIKACLRPKSERAVDLITYRVDRILDATANHTRIEGT